MFRFRLWFAAVILSALGIWLAGRSHEARAQRRCVGEIQRSGGRVYYDYAACRGSIPAGASPYSRLLVRLCGDDFLHNVIRIDLPAGADGIDLDTLRSVEMVVLHGDGVDDDDVRAIAGLRQLRHLKIVSHQRNGRFRRTKISDKSLALIGQLPSLETVAVEGRGLSPEGVNLLLRAPRLQSARIHGVDWSDFTAFEVPHNVRLEISRIEIGSWWAGPTFEDKRYCVVGSH
jgi:hypothetical protein